MRHVPSDRNIRRCLCLTALLGGLALGGGCGSSTDAQVQGAVQTASAASLATAGRVIFVAIDSLHPAYLELNADASGPGKAGDWLMPRVRQFVTDASNWTAARAHMPTATDMNHLNVVAGTTSGTNGILGVNVQPEDWGPLGMKLGKTHLSKAKYADGQQVETLFDLVEQASGGAARTAYLSNKAWVASMFDELDGAPANVDLVVNGSKYPSYIPRPQAASFYDNPATDPDHACDPESDLQKEGVDSTGPRKHPRDSWIVDATLAVLDREQTDLMYVILADLDHAQHFIGAVDHPAEWVAGPPPPLPDGCTPLPRYNLRSKRNPQLYKEPILDLIREVDVAFGRLIDQLKARGLYESSNIVLVSDHNMTNHLYRADIEPLTDVETMLTDAGLATKRDMYFYGATSIGLIYYRPAAKRRDPTLVARAKAELLSATHLAYNHETGATELPWDVLDRQEMVAGRPDLNILPLELYHPFFAENGDLVWPDLIVAARNGWQLTSGTFNVGGIGGVQLFQAGHGAPDTGEVVVAIRGLGFAPGKSCGEQAWLSDVAATVAAGLGGSLSQSVGKPLTCN